MAKKKSDPSIPKAAPKKRKGQKDLWDMIDVRATFTEALGFAKVCAETWKATAKEPDAATVERYWSAPLGIERARLDYNDPRRVAGADNFTETALEAQSRVVDRFVLLTARIAGVEPGSLPMQWYQREDRVAQKNSKAILELITSSMPDLVGGVSFRGSIFRYGTPDPVALEQLQDVWARGREAARSAYAGTGPLSPDERRTLLEWKALDRPLRYREVTELLYGGRSYSTQESRTGRFLERFSSKVKGQKGDGEKVPYQLRPEALARQIDATDIPAPGVGAYDGMDPSRIDIRIARLEAEIAALQALKQKNSEPQSSTKEAA